MRRRVNVADGSWLRAQPPNSLENRPRFGGSGSGAGGSGRLRPAAADRPPAGASTAAPLRARAGRGSPRSSRRAATRPPPPSGYAAEDVPPLVGSRRCASTSTPSRRSRGSPGAAVSHDDVVGESADGNRFAAFRAVPDGDVSTGVVILPGRPRPLPLLRGARAALRRARLRRDRLRLLRPHRRRREAAGRLGLHAARAAAHAGAGAGRRRAPASATCARSACTTIFTVGFCFGGSGSWAAAAWGHGLAGAVGFYGRPSRMIELVPRLEAPILALQGGADQGIPHEDNVAFEQALQRRRQEVRADRVRGRAAQLLRPQAGGVPGGVRRRLAAHARLHRGELVTVSQARARTSPRSRP